MAQVPTNGLVAHYKLNGNTIDSSGFRNHGMPNGNLTYGRDSFGNCAKAAYFNGVNNYISCGTDTSIRLKDSLTIMVWINFDSGPKSYNPRIISYGANNPAPHDGYDFFTFDNKGASPHSRNLSLYFGRNLLTSPRVLQSRIWYHVAATITISGLRLYINGSLDSWLDVNALPVTYVDAAPMEIGRKSKGTSFVDGIWTGYLDDIRIYNRVLSGNEILQIFRLVETDSRPRATLSPTNPNICSGSTTTLTALPDGKGLTYQWYRNDTLLQRDTNNTLIINAIGQYRVRITDSLGCDSLSTVVIPTSSASPIPDVRDTAICPNTTALLWIRNNTANFSRYSWSTVPISTTPTIAVTPSVSTTYFVTVTDTKGCSGVDSAKVTVYPVFFKRIDTTIGFQQDIRLPNGDKKTVQSDDSIRVTLKTVGGCDSIFLVSWKLKIPKTRDNIGVTPLGETNRTFLVPETAFGDCEVSIFSRNHQRLFHTPQYQNDWAGDGLPSGTYYFVLRYRDKDGWVTKTGDITLLKERK